MKLNLPETENKILKFWKKKKIFEKTLEKTKKGRRFVFYEGPPFANGLPGIHHLLTRAFKDIILRYKTMQGFFVERKSGWDTHGLPTEVAAEKCLDIKSKRDIDKIGTNKFIKECENNVFTYKKKWENFTDKIGFWLDLKNPYITCSNNYIESLWWILKQIWNKGLLIEDYKVVPYCPRCGTSLSSHEVAQGYKRVEENSAYVKFKLKNQKDTFFLIWTTTPWTLPGNAALALNKNFKYVKVKVAKEFLILAKERLDILENYEIVEEYKGKDLAKIEYNPLFNFIKPDKKAHYTILADFVSLGEGTGIVHIAPAFGIDDMEAAKENNIPVLMTVSESGKFKKEISNWAGMFVKNADPLIIQELKKRNLLFKEELYEHDYPFCWRCNTPLLYYAKNSWFIKMTKIKKELIENSQEISWEPSHIKKGRFGEWLKEVKDWNLSRERYWGTPLPIWKCSNCKNLVCVGSIKEIEELGGKKPRNMHKPYIDNVILKCEECGEKMRRVPEVIDCWFDSGSMPFAQWHYPFENKEKIDRKESFPADFISEAVDQTRGWFYTLLAVSTLLGRKAPYRNVICLGLVLDENGQKMSKSKGNIINPDEVIGSFGADAARFYFYTVNSAGEPKRFDFKELKSLYRKFFDTLHQSYVFLSTYASLAKPIFSGSSAKLNLNNVLDKWIVSRLENVNLKVTESLNNYDVVSAARMLNDFVDDLSNWYIRRSRLRFKEQDQKAVETLYCVLLKFSKLTAPFTPFFAEEFYKNLKGKKESVHLENYPKADKKLIDKKLEEKMEQVREIVSLTLAKRMEAGIKVRQPLRKLTIKIKLDKSLLKLIKDEVNVKEVVAGRQLELDTKITEELKKEGETRELIRAVNNIRKEMGLTPRDKVVIESTFDLENKKEFLKQIRGKKYNLKQEMKKGRKVKINSKDYFIKVDKV